MIFLDRDPGAPVAAEREPRPKGRGGARDRSGRACPLQRRTFRHEAGEEPRRCAVVGAQRRARSGRAVKTSEATNAAP